MSIHPEYEFMACSNKLEVVCSGSGYEPVTIHLEVPPSVEKSAVENTRLARNICSRTFCNYKGQRLVNTGGSF